MTNLTRRRFVTAAALSGATFSIASKAMAREPNVFQRGGVAINGYDPVAYFNQSQPVEGVSAHRVSYNGATWHFATRANAEAFAGNPDRYAPVFGGYCAYAASRGYLAPSIPEAWTVYEGKLYLNASLRARELWLRDVPGNIAKGHANWPGILG